MIHFIYSNYCISTVKCTAYICTLHMYMFLILDNTTCSRIETAHQTWPALRRWRCFQASPSLVKMTIRARQRERSCFRHTEQVLVAIICGKVVDYSHEPSVVTTSPWHGQKHVSICLEHKISRCQCQCHSEPPGNWWGLWTQSQRYPPCCPASQRRSWVKHQSKKIQQALSLTIFTFVPFSHKHMEKKNAR